MFKIEIILHRIYDDQNVRAEWSLDIRCDFKNSTWKIDFEAIIGFKIVFYDMRNCNASGLPNGNDTKIYIDTRHNAKLDELIEMASSTQPVVMHFVILTMMMMI